MLATDKVLAIDADCNTGKWRRFFLVCLGKTNTATIKLFLNQSFQVLLVNPWSIAIDISLLV